MLSKFFMLICFVLVFALFGAYIIFFSQASSLSADFNNDSTVNVIDLSILASNWGKSGTASTGDTNNDGTVNVMDLSALASQWGQTAAPTPTPTPSGNFALTGLSASHALAGSSITITGNGFGSAQGNSKVTFGERINEMGFAPVAKQAIVTSWSNTSITVTVPGMSPGKAGEHGTYHPVYVTVNGNMTNSMDFYMDPVTIISSTGSYTQAQIQALFRGDAGITWNQSNHTITASGAQGCDIAANMHDILFDGITFRATSSTINGNNAGVLTMGEGWTRNITFLNSTIASNTGPGLGSGEWGVNGIKIKQFPNNIIVEDITFSGVTVESMSRMGIETINESGGAITYPSLNIALTASNAQPTTFDPIGTEAISYNGGGNNRCYYLIDGVLIKGFGNDPNKTWIGAGFETNRGTHMEIRNMTIWHGKDTAFNISGDTGLHMNLYFYNTQARYDIIDSRQTQLDTSSATIFGGSHHDYITWRNSYFHMGDEPNHVLGAGSANNWDTGANDFGYYNDFGGSVLTGRMTWTTIWGNGELDPSNILPTYQNIVSGG